MTSISLPRIAIGVGGTLFAALLFLGMWLAYPGSCAPASEWIAAAAKVVIVATIGSTAVVGFLALCAAFVWVWFKSGVAFGHVPRWHFGWIFNPTQLSEEGRAARSWLLLVYGVLALMGVIAHLLQQAGVL
jgi:hypothetical protein